MEKIFGVVVGIVSDNKDPKNAGRVKVKFPWLADDFSSNWLRISSQMAGPGRGSLFMPEVDDEVLVAFEHGDVERGFVIGSLWNGVDKPHIGNSDAVEGGKVRHRRIKTRYGHILDFDDDGSITLQTKEEHRLLLRDDDGSVHLSTNNGFKIQAADDAKQIVVGSPAGYAIGISDQTMTVGIFDPQGNHIKIQTLAGMIHIKASNAVSIDAGAVVNIKGAMVNINSGPMPDDGQKVKSKETGKVNKP